MESYRANEKRKKDAKARNKEAAGGIGGGEDDEEEDVVSHGDVNHDKDTTSAAASVSTPHSVATAESLDNHHYSNKGMDPPQEGMVQAHGVDEHDNDSTEEEATEEEEEEELENTSRHDTTSMDDGSSELLQDVGKKRKRDYEQQPEEDSTE